jgi:NADPH:quinone reductase-like Zn-dependent oxidoreductase
VTEDCLQERRTRLPAAYSVHSFGGPDVLKFEDVADPAPGKGEVLVKTLVQASSPFGFKMRSGAMKDLVAITVPAILRVDIAGAVSALGPGVTTFKPHA